MRRAFKSKVILCESARSTGESLRLLAGPTDLIALIAIRTAMDGACNGTRLGERRWWLCPSVTT